MSGGQDTTVDTVRAEVIERLAALPASAVRPAVGGVRAEDVIDQVLDAHIQRALSAGERVWTREQESRIRGAVRDALLGMGGIQPLLNDDRIENININGCDQVFVRYADGTRAQRDPVARSDEELVDLIRVLASRGGTEERRFDRGAPRLSMQLADGSRLFAVMAVTGRPSVSIRRHRYPTAELPQLRRGGMLDHRLEQLLQAAVRARYNLLIAGGTGVGKTTLLRGLASAIPPAERLVTIEDALELGLDRDPLVHPDVVALQAREANTEGEGEITQAELVRWALRMSPDRVIVGEVRGPEVIPMIQAMSQGNDGSMATIHSSTSRGVWTRLAAYAMQADLTLDAVNLMIASAIHLVVQLAWSTDGQRVVTSIREVVDADGPLIISNEIFRPGPDRRAVPAAPLRAETLANLLEHGFALDLLTDPAAGWTPC